MDHRDLIVVIGAGPAGLTAARELLRENRFRVIVLEASCRLGGISTTVSFHGNRMDLLQICPDIELVGGNASHPGGRGVRHAPLHPDFPYLVQPPFL